MKKLLFIAGGIALASLVFAGNKLSKISAILEKLQTKLAMIRNVDFDFNKNYISFLLDFEIYNPTRQHLSISTGKIITIKRILFYDENGKLFGTANTNVAGINVPALGVTRINNVLIETTITEGLSDFYKYLTADSNSVKIELEFEALNQRFTTGLNGIITERQFYQEAAPYYAKKLDRPIPSWVEEAQII